MFEFDPGNIGLVTLVGFFKDRANLNPRHVQLPVAPEVQEELKVMLDLTLAKLELPQAADAIPLFSPAEKYDAEEPSKLPLTTDYMAGLADVVSLQNLPSDTGALQAVDELNYYYAIFTDGQGRNLYAFRRASSFKLVSKSKLAFISNGLLTLVEGNVFRLDNDFDYVVDASTIYILRHTGLEFTTNVHEQMLAAAAQNAAAVSAAINFLDVQSVSAWTSRHPRGARLLAAVRGRPDLHLTNRNLLEAACQEQGVPLTQNPDGTITPDPGHEYEFLLVLDRRAYIANLIPNEAERYEAASRRRR